MPRRFILPTPEEDAAITAAANADPDARPFTDADLEQVKPLVRRGTDWERVKREAAQDAPVPFEAGSEPYDPNDPAAVAAYWAKATVKRGRGRPAGTVKRPTLNMRVDADVLEAFKATGPGWQTRINEVLKDWVKSHA